VPVDFPRFSHLDLSVLNGESRTLFIRERIAEDPGEFRKLYKRYAADVAEFLTATGDLGGLTADALLRSVRMQDVARHLTAPPISQDDLSTLIDRNPGHKNRMSAEEATRAVGVFRATVNADLCPWLAEDRAPTAAERSTTVTTSATLMAVERLRTNRRNASSKVQEKGVQRVLDAIGFDRIEVARNRLASPEALPPGRYASETAIANKKCDIPIRMRDGRFLALECKVSNSERNGWKRLKAEVVSKKYEWTEWGEAAGIEVIVGAVVSGLFDLSCLIFTHEEKGVALFWQHKLDRLAAFLLET